MDRDIVTRDRHVVLANLTGHPLRMIGSSARTVDIPVEGRARIKSDMTLDYRAHVRGVVIPVLDVHEQEVDGLPRPIPGILYVVSGIVAANVDRDDVVCPGRVERTRSGKVVGCHALVHVNRDRDGGDA